VCQRSRLAGCPRCTKGGSAEPGADRSHVPGDSGLLAGVQRSAELTAQGLSRRQEPRRLVQVLLRHGDLC
jgi:hypothetical protein